jgi:hypothetical protein
VYTRFNCGSSNTTGTYSSTGYSSINTRYSDEGISDNTGRAQANEVHHRKLDVIIDDAMPDLVLPLSDGTGGRIHYANRNGQWPKWNADDSQDMRAWNAHNAHNQTGVPYRWTIENSHPNENSLKLDCIERARQLKADVLLNIVEANQIWPSIRSLATCLPQMASNWKQIRKVVRTAAGGYLAWKFGVSPILSDSMNIVQYLKRMKDDLKRHVDGAPFRSVVKIVLNGSFNNTPISFGLYNGVEFARIDYEGHFSSAPVIRYVLVVKPKIQYQTELFQKLDLCLSRFATSPASLAWEKVPFSFVADWFVDIRGFLNKVDSALGFEPFEVLGFTRSYNYDATTNQTITYRETCGGGILRQYIACACRYRHYERIPVSMSAKALSWKPRFGKNQAGISAALIAQKLSSLRANR